jgi:hypothetical protein
MSEIEISNQDESTLERSMQIFWDIKKSFWLDITRGSWHWFDKDDPETLSEGFETFRDMLRDAVDPYLETSEELGDAK